MKKLLLLGGGGHCRSVLDSILASSQFDEIGIVDNNISSFLGITVVGTDNDLPRLIKDGWTDAFITVGSVGDTSLRRKLYMLLKEIGFNLPNIIDPTAIIAGDCSLQEGVFIGKHAVINAGTTIEACCIINTGSIVEHDCSISEFAHISPGVILCGQVKIGSDSHIGAGSVIRQQIKIGRNTLVGMGSVVVEDMPDNVKAYGNPCKVVD